MTQSDSDRHQAFLRAFMTHEPAVRAYVRRLLSSRTDVDDVLQEVAIVLWEKFDEFRPGGDFRAWAYGIARYKVLSWLRDQGRGRLVLASDVIELIAEESVRDDSRLGQQREVMESCIKKMSPVEKDLLSRAYEPAVKIQDVAASSGRSIGGFYQWLHRMRRLLLDCVQRRLVQESFK